MKAIKSTDSRKPAIMSEVKRVTGCRKVTNVRQRDDTHFVADAIWIDGTKRNIRDVEVVVKL